jgi:hypothetical protein
VKSVAGHVRGRSSVSRSTGSCASSWLLSGEASSRMSGYGSGPGLTHPDLAPRPSARRFDGLAGSVVAWVLPLEKREHALRAVGGREGPRPMVLGGPPSQACRRCLLGVVFVTLLCHGFSVQPQWTQVPLPDRPARGLPGLSVSPSNRPCPDVPNTRSARVRHVSKRR